MAAKLIAEVTAVEGTLPKGAAHVGPTTIVKGSCATEPNVCPGDLEI